MEGSSGEVIFEPRQNQGCKVLEEGYAWQREQVQKFEAIKEFMLLKEQQKDLCG